jgi:hypothetical protein
MTTHVLGPFLTSVTNQMLNRSYRFVAIRQARTNFDGSMSAQRTKLPLPETTDSSRWMDF